MMRTPRLLLITVATAAVAAVPTVITAPSATAAGSWTVQKSGTTQPLYGVDFVDRLHGWAVGGSGTILVTSDGGTHWTKQASGTTYDLRGVAFPNRSRGWVTGWGNKLLLTTADGGKHWTKVASYPVTAVAALDAKHAIAVGSAAYSTGVIVRTLDGTHWSTVGSPISGGYVDAVDYATANIAYAAGTRFSPTMRAVMLKSTNGGKTWTQKVTSAAAKFHDMDFVDSTHGCALGYEDNLLLRTTNGGATWLTQPLPKYLYAGHAYPREADGISFAGQLRGLMATSGTIDHRVVYATADGGKTWKPSFTAGSGRGSYPTAYDVDMVDATHAWAVGTNGRIIRFIG